MLQSFTSMQQLASFAKTAKGDFSYRWYGEPFTSCHRAGNAPIMPESWRAPVLRKAASPMKAIFELLLWFLVILAVVLLPVLLHDWYIRHKHQTANPARPVASFQCNIALPKSPAQHSPIEEPTHAPRNL